MTEDARFADAAGPLRLVARSPEDLEVLSALCQDAVLTATDMRLDRRARRFALLLGRFRWEERRSPPERVRSLLVFDDVLSAASDGIERTEATVLSLLATEWAQGTDGTGTITLRFAGDGAVKLEVETIEAQLRDVTKPYIAPSGQVPRH